MAENIHWSRQFKKPQASTKMSGATGMSDGNGKPTVNMAKWHAGKLYMAGVWLAGIDGRNLEKRDVNVNWYMWSFCESEGYRPIAWQHSANGGPGPVGVINDFVFLPDGRLVVGGEFLKIGNLHGHSFHRIKGLAIYDSKEPTATRWKPFANTVQKNGPGTINSLAYDLNENSLWVGGGFQGYRMDPTKLEQFCFAIQKYNLTEEKWYIYPPGLRGGTICHKIKVDTTTSPSTIYIAGRFSHCGGNGKASSDNGTSGYSHGFCAFREDIGWITFPQKNPKSKNETLQRAADFAYFDSVNVLDFLLDDGDIWIVGAFSEGKTNKGPLRGIAKWDQKLQTWIDPTGRGGFGREVYAITKTDDEKIYVAGAFGGEKSGGHYDGFKNGEMVHMAACYDKKTNTWKNLGAGLGGFSMPVCRVTSLGNDVYFYGTFRTVGRDARKNGFESYYLARWNEYMDFTKYKADKSAIENILAEPAIDAPEVKKGLEHWSRNFPHPGRMVGGKTKQNAKSGMDNGVGTPDIKAMRWHNGTLYIGGSWEMLKGERWFVWTYHPEAGWNRLAWQERGGKKFGFASIPAGLKWHNGRMYVYGASEDWRGIAVYDPSNNSWNEFGGTYDGKPIKGNGAQGNPPINDVAWDSKTGDMYLAGSCGEKIRYKTGHKGGTVPSQVLRVDKNGVYHPMGLMLLAQNPNKPEISVNCILLDETKNPTDLYIGGCFGFKGANSNLKNAVYSVAKWNFKENDWGPIGKGNYWRIGMHGSKAFPKGQPGLKGQPIYGFPTFLRELWPRVRCLAMDKFGNLYAGGAIGILDDNPNIHKRDEQYGLVKYDLKLDRWVGATNCRGVSRDVFQMTWLDDKHLLVTGGFLYSEDFRLMNNIAVLDITTGKLESLAGGVHKPHDGHVVSCNVVHCLAADGYWFGGFFQYAGVGKKSRAQAPVESNFIAHYNPKKNMDPNGGMSVIHPGSVKGVKGYSSQNRDVELKAKDVPDGGTVVWYQSAHGRVKKLGTGNAYKAKVRVSQKDTSFTFFASVLTKGGIEGGKIPIVVPVEAL